uniref:Uncharacterized protein n=1 Tax=Amphimedon queenslandica TaxID=400682 RepID=A0A1X7UPJ2_AMPQE
MADKGEDPPDPMNGDLIDLLQESERCVDKTSSIQDILFEKFQRAHPHINVGCPNRLYDTLKHIAAPTQPSLRGISKISGSDLEAYRSKVWVPRIRNPGPKDTVFSKELKAYGLDEELLIEVFSQVLQGKENLWCGD